MRILTIFIITFLSIANLSAQTQQDTIHYFDDLFPKSGLFMKPDSPKNGTWIAFCETNKNQIGLILHYMNGKLNGEMVSYWPNGNIQQKGFYQDGCFVGLNEKWYEGGIKESVSNCKIIDVKLSFYECSLLDYWTSDGKQLIIDGTGSYLSYYDNGILQVNGNYHQGNQTGKWTWYYSNGNLQYIENFIDGKEDGEYIYYFINGNIRTTGTYSKGKQVGKWEEWYQDGKPRQTEYWTDGIMQGDAKYWYSNGQLSSEGNYNLGNENGIWKYWDENGKLVNEIRYSNGEIVEEKNYR